MCSEVWLLCPATLAQQCVQAGRHHKAPNRKDCVPAQPAGRPPGNMCSGLRINTLWTGGASEDRAVVLKACASGPAR